MSIPIIERLQSHFTEKVECDETSIDIDDQLLLFFETSGRELHVEEEFIMASFLPRLSDDVIALFFEQFDQAASFFNKDVICIKSKSLLFTDALLLSYGFRRVDELSPYHWIKERVPGYVEAGLNIITSIHSFAQTLTAQDPTFVLQNNTLRHSWFVQRITFYYKGERGRISMNHDESEWSLGVETFRTAVIDSPPLIIDQETDLTLYLQHAFRQIERQKRLENVFSPPNYHFKNFLINRLNISSPFIQGLFYDFFLALMDGEEMEILFATLKEQDAYRIHSDCGKFFFYQIGQWQFILRENEGKHKSFHSFSDPVAASQFYIEACRDSFEARLEDQMQSFLKKITT